MEDFLFEKLNGRVSNDNLPLFGSVCIDYGADETPTAVGRWLNITVNGGVVKLKSAGFAPDGTHLDQIDSTEITLDGTNGEVTRSFYLTNISGRLVIENKYCLYLLQVNGRYYENFHFKDWTCMSILNYLSVCGSIEGLGVLPQCKGLTISPDSVGTDKDLRGLIASETIEIRNGALVGGTIQSKTNGETEKVIEGQINNGRVSGTLEFKAYNFLWYLNSVRYGGIRYIVFEDGSAKVYTDQACTQRVAYYNGSTWDYSAVDES